MKLQKYIFLLFILLGLYQPDLKAESIFIKDEHEIIFVDNFQDATEEQSWLGLLYLKERTVYQSYFLKSQSESFQNFLEDKWLKFPRVYFRGVVGSKNNGTLKLQNHENLKRGLEDYERVGNYVFNENPELVDGWKRLDDLEADAILKSDPDALKYVENGRTNKINIEVEELLGGHSKARHGSHLSMSEMEQRVLGTHSSMPQSRSALKFDSDAIHEDAVSKAFQQHKSTIDNHFSTSDDYLELDFDYGSKVGEGFTNTGTRRNPVVSSKIRIALKKDPTNPDGYILDSAYPLYE